MTTREPLSAWLLLDEGDNEAARREFEQYISENPDDHGAYVGLGKALARLDRTREALEVFKTALLLDPASSAAHCGLGSAYSYLGLYTDALEAFKEAIRTDPENSDAHYGAAWIYNQIGDRNKAASHAKTAADLAPDVARNHFLAAYSIGSMNPEVTLWHLERVNRLERELLDRRWRAILIGYRIFAGSVHSLQQLLIGWALIAAVYATSLSGGDLQRWLWVATLPFLGVSGYNLVKHRYYRAIWAAGLGLLWLVAMYLLFVVGKGA